MASLLGSRLKTRGALARVFRERLSEPLHLNAIAAVVALFGDHRAKVYWDLKYRQYTAYCLLNAADRARRLGVRRVSAVEFGVASGAGLLNICENAAATTKITGVEFEIYGFDTGAGLPPPRSYRDHPELYQDGDYRMDVPTLRARLPPNADLVLGDIADTVPAFLRRARHAPLAYVALDVDYYWSAVEALQILCGAHEQYMPLVLMYLDDCHDAYHNPSCGELLACEELNLRETFRKVYPFTALREKRLFKNASWISKVWTAHILDHELRTLGAHRTFAKELPNPYLAAVQAR